MTGRAGAIAAVLMVGLGSGARAQISIRGSVIDPVSRKPARGVRVEFAPSLAAWTGDSGQFAATLPAATYQVNLSCPRRDAAQLRAQGPRFVVTEPARIELELPGGVACLPALSATEYGEFEGIYISRPGGGWFRLCGDTTYQITATFSAAGWSSLNRLAGQATSAKNLALIIGVRGELAGPGVFEGADYRIGVEVARAARFGRPESCR